MPRPTRRELKQDEFRTTFEQFEQFAKQRYKEIAAAASLFIVVGGLAAGLKYYADRREAEANEQLAVALKTFHSYIGTAEPGSLGAEAETYSTAREKYKKALDEFSKITAVKGLGKFLPEPKAVAVARYHVGLCQAELGDHSAATKTMEQAGRASDPSLASLAKLALAGELANNGKLPEALKLYQELADHPSLTVPRATALLAKADASRFTQPGQARRIYEQMEKEFGSDVLVEEAIKQHLASLPK